MLARRHIPNLLTVARVAAVPLALGIICLKPGWTVTLFFLFLLAAITDFFDGHLARKWNVVSSIGTLLDPIADKLLVALMFIYLLIVMGNALLLPVCIILLRELYISGLREFLAAKNIALPVSKGGKLKTTLQMLAIGTLLGKLAYNPPGQINFPCKLVQMGDAALSTDCIGQPWVLRICEAIGLPLLYAAALVTLLTAVDYTLKARKSF